MLKRSYGWPKGHWSWPIAVTHKHGLRCGRMIFVGGQVDLDSAGGVQHPGDLEAQTTAAVANLRRVLAEFGAGTADLVKLLAFYVAEGGVAEDRVLAQIGHALGASGGPVITLVPVPWLAYPRMLIEIEGIAMLGERGEGLRRSTAGLADGPTLPRPFAHGVRCGEMIYVGAQSACGPNATVIEPANLPRQSTIVMDRLGEILACFGAGFEDVVKINTYYVGGGTQADWEVAAKVRAGYFSEPGPAATGIPLHRHNLPGRMTKSEVIAMLGEDGRRLPRRHVWPEGHWDWPIHLPYKHGIECGGMIFVGGQVSLTPQGEVIAPGDMVAQTRTSMDNIRRVLAGFGARLDDVVKVTAFYRGGASADGLHANLRVRSASFSDPGPTSTGIALPYLAYEGMEIEIEVVAMAD